MKIIVDEYGFNTLLKESLIEHNTNNYSNVQQKLYQPRIDSAINTLEKFLLNYGVVMRNTQNEKDYLVFELKPLTDLVGRRYGMVQLMKDGKPFNSIYIKPIEQFKMIY